MKSSGYYIDSYINVSLLYINQTVKFKVYIWFNFSFDGENSSKFYLNL